MANRCTLVFVLSLWVIADTGNGIDRMDMTKSRGNTLEIRHQLRHRRNSAVCLKKTDKNGYLPLTKDKVKVRFFKDGSIYFANVTWQKPKVNNSIPISAFAVFWCTYSQYYNTDCRIFPCQVVENKTSFIIKQSSKWLSDQVLGIQVIPLPLRSQYKAKLLTFDPSLDIQDITKKIFDEQEEDNVDNSKNSSFGKNNSSFVKNYSTRSDITKKIFDKKEKVNVDNSNNSSFRKNNSMHESDPGAKHNDDNSKIVVIAAVTGISMAIVLVVIAMVCYYKRAEHHEPQPSDITKKIFDEQEKDNLDNSKNSSFGKNNSSFGKNNSSFGKNNSTRSELYYVSYFSKSESHIRKVKDFVFWLRGKGFDVQMDQILSDANKDLLREIGPFRFGEVLMNKAKNVIMIVSPSYASLCRLDEREQGHENLSHDEKIANLEIAYIRNGLYSTAFRNDKFIPILFDVEEARLPFWIKELLLYTWPEDKMNDRLLYRLHNQPEYLPEKPGVDV